MDTIIHELCEDSFVTPARGLAEARDGRPQRGAGKMADVGVALAWIAISAASAKALAALARSAVSSELDAEIADGQYEDMPARMYPAVLVAGAGATRP
jgi:hypothetical protein